MTEHYYNPNTCPTSCGLGVLEHPKTPKHNLPRKCLSCGHRGKLRGGICRQIVGADCSDPYGEECECACATKIIPEEVKQMGYSF